MASNIISINTEVVDAESKNFGIQRDEMLGLMKNMDTSIRKLSDGLVGSAGSSVQAIYPEMKKTFDRSEQLMNAMSDALKQIEDNFIDTDRKSKVSM